MSKIEGRFAPLTEELGNDDRFINDLTDLQKLLYILIVYTCHMTRHKAPANPNFYKKRYGLKAPNSALKAGLNEVRRIYPKLRITLEGDKEFLSLENSVTYKNGILHRIRKEEEKEREVEAKEPRTNVFKKPTLEELKVLFGGKGFPAEAEKFFGHYEANGWRVGRNPMRSVQHAVANWIRNMGTYGGKAEAKPVVKRELKPRAGCEACGGTGKLPDGPKCWCWS